MKCFNPHTHEGCDKAFSLYNVMPQVSIHTPTKGVTAGAEYHRTK